MEKAHILETKEFMPAVDLDKIKMTSLELFELFKKYDSN